MDVSLVSERLIGDETSMHRPVSYRESTDE